MSGLITISDLPPVRGILTEQASLARLSWFRTGGPADVVFEPADEADLSHFLSSLPLEIPITVLGVGSNLLVRDGGIRGVVIKLGKAFSAIKVDEDRVTAGAGAMDVHVAKAVADAGLSGLEFLVGVPGTIGGALRMNAGAYGREMGDCFIVARGIDRSGNPALLSLADMSFTYRHSSLPTSLIFTEATMSGTPGDTSDILARMDDIKRQREDTQPIGTRTGGSTFKNPDPEESNGRKAWELVDAAGCRGLRVGGAGVSEKHCNFLINYGDASASDIETLGNQVRNRVLEETGVLLEWEIKCLGSDASKDTS